MAPATAAKVQIATQSLTAEDPLQQKQRDAGVVSGGRLVTTAAKNMGVAKLGGGHIIDLGRIDNSRRIIEVRRGQAAALLKDAA